MPFKPTKSKSAHSSTVRKTAHATKPQIGFWTAVSLVIGTIVGAGAFLLPSVIARYGAAGLVGWAVSGVGAIFLAMNFARISQRIAGVGGPYQYARTSLGEWAGFQVATSFVIRGTVTIAALALVCVSYLSSVFPVLQHDLMLKSALACALIASLMGVNYYGMRPVALILVVSTALKLIPLAFMAFVGIWFIDIAHFTPLNLSDVSLTTAIMTAASLTFFSLMGMESATVPSSDVRDPKTTIPRATLFGALTVVVLYLLSATAVMGIVPPVELAATDAPYSAALGRLLGDDFARHAGSLMAGFILISCLGAMNGHMLTLTKLPQAAAEDGMFPRAFAHTNRHGTPWLGLTLSGLGACALICLTASDRVSAQFEIVISISCFLGLLIYCMSSFTELLLLAQEKKKLPAVSMVMAVTTAVGAFAFCLWAMNGISQKLGFGCLMIIFLMLPLYAFSRLAMGKTVKNELGTNKIGK